MTSTARSNRLPDDRGAVLMLTLVITVVLAAVVLAIATYTTTALRTSRVTSELVDTLAAAESGIQYELSAVDSGTCASTTSRGTINGAAVTSTCSSVFRTAQADTKFALVVTKDQLQPATVALDTRGSNSFPNAERKISGPIYLGEGVTVDLVQTSAVLTDESTGTEYGGDVRYDVPGDCTGLGSDDGPADPAQWKAPNLPVVSCDSRGWQAVAPTPDLSAFTPPSTAIASTSSGGCDLYSPGIQSGGTLDVDGDAFLQSGVYYFVDVDITIEDDVAIGRRPNTDFPAAYPSSCTSAAEFASDPQTGALLILAGTSSITFDKSSATFYPIAFDGDEYSVVALNASASGYAPASLDPDSERLIDRRNPAQTDFRFYGRVYAPRSWIDTGNAANDAIVEFLGGLVAARATIQTAARVDGFSISVPTELARFFLVEATAVAGSVTTVRGTARDLEPGTQVLTWRVCSQLGC